MRPTLAFLLIAALTAPPALAGVVTVDAPSQTVESSRLKLIFDFGRPDFLRTVFFKDWDPGRDLAGEDGQVSGVNSPGYVDNNRLESHTWEVLQSPGPMARIRVQSESTGQPPVTTTYTFYADQPWFVVERTVHFSQLADSAASQYYSPRVAFWSSYRALRYRDVSGRFVQKGYCYAGCTTPSWDGHWLEHISLATQDSFSVAQIYPDTISPGTTIVRGSGPESFAGWVSPLSPAGLRNTDVTTRMMIAFSTSVSDTTKLDSLWAFFNAGGSWTVDVPTIATAASARPRLAVSPNPAAGPAHLSWTLPAAGRVTLEVLDVTGRRVAELFEGEAAAGPHALRWDGRDAAGRAVPPGVYLARLVTPGAIATTRLVRVR
jgi:hypothetical protein